MHLSRDTQKQQKLLIDEYERIGKPLERFKVPELVRQVDLQLSKNQQWVIRDSNKGPDGQTQFLSNHKISAWIPACMPVLPNIMYDTNGIPMVQEKNKAKTSHYCIDLLMANHSVAPSMPSQVVPLPGSAKAAPALPPVAYGSPPLPGMVPNDSIPAPM